MRSETGMRKEAQSRWEQPLMDLKRALVDAKATADQQEMETAQRFSAAADALAVEDAKKRAEEKELEKAIDVVRDLIKVEKAARIEGETCLRTPIAVLQSQLRDETLMRVELDRRTAQGVLDLGARLKAEA